MVMDTALKEKDTPQAKVDKTPLGKVASPGDKEPSPKGTPLTYTQEQVDKLTQLASMKGGRDRKALEVKIGDYEKKIVAIEAERETLQKQIDDLAKDDPDKFALIKRDKELRDREKKLQDSLTTHEADKTTHAQLLKDAKKHETLTKIYLTSEKYADGDADKLAELCEKFGAETEEEINSVAETLWSKKEEETTPPLETDSGKTSGGAISGEQAILNRLYPSMAKK